MSFRFKGGVHPSDSKLLTNEKSIEMIKAPDRVYLPVSMHIGAKAEPIVKIGDKVKIGQKIAQATSMVSACVHASISGEVVEIAEKLHPNGQNVVTIVIENDFKDEILETIRPISVDDKTPEQLVDIIKDAGIVGHGGAAFPTHVKLNSALNKIDTIIINGAECEPYITSDHRLMFEKADELIAGIAILEKIFNVSNILIGIENNKKNVFPIINEQILKLNSKAKVVELHTRFPQGAEKQLIYSLTKREVPSGKLPADVSTVVLNVDTVISINTLFKTGLPMIRRIVTVSGSAVANPKNLHAPIGTLISHLIDNAGGLKRKPNKLIVGGPMMGTSVYTLNIPVIKGTNAFLAFSEDEDVRVKDPACLKCGKCVEVCPMGLVPVYMAMYTKKELMQSFEEIGGMDCIECGSCSYICPARIQLVQAFKTSKQKVLNNKK